MIAKYVATKQLVKADVLYKMVDEKDNNKAMTISQWQKKFAQENNVSEVTAKQTIENGIKKGWLVPLEQRYVTKEDLDREREMLKMLKLGMGKKRAYYNHDTAEQILSKSTLNEGQKSAAKLIMTTTDRVVGIQGYAGVGKSYTLSETLKHIEAAGGKTHVFAPYGSQVKSLQADGHDAKTLAKLLHSPKLQKEITADSLIVVDEAGVIANKDMHKLLQIVREKNAKLVLLGDTQQTKAISAGKPFDVFQQQGMAMATIDEIQRQKDSTLKQAVEEAAKDNPTASIKTLEKSVYEIQDKKERLDSLVDQYMQIPSEDRKNTLIVTGTNADKDYINQSIRSQLGYVGKGVEVEQLKRLDRSAAELKHARYYNNGEIIEIYKPSKNTELEKGQFYQVVGKNGHQLIVQNKEGKNITVSPNVEKIIAYDSQTLEISVGDKLKVTKGDVAMGTVTGDKLIVEQIKKGKIYAKDEKTGETHIYNTKEKNHLDYDYCSTVHSSQGLTVDRVLINLDTQSKTTSKELYYVAVSRARQQAIVMTDNIEKLPQVIAKGAEKHSAYNMAKYNDAIQVQKLQLKHVYGE